MHIPVWVRVFIERSFSWRCGAPTGGIRFLARLRDKVSSDRRCRHGAPILAPGLVLFRSGLKYVSPPLE